MFDTNKVVVEASIIVTDANGTEQVHGGLISSCSTMNRSHCFNESQESPTARNNPTPSGVPIIIRTCRFDNHIVSSTQPSHKQTSVGDQPRAVICKHTMINKHTTVHKSAKSVRYCDNLEAQDLCYIVSISSTQITKN